MPTPYIVCAAVYSATEESLRKSFATSIGRGCKWYGHQIKSCECVLTSTRKLPIHAQEKDEKAVNISETNRFCVLEKRHVELLQRKIVIKENCQETHYNVLGLHPWKWAAQKTFATIVERSCVRVPPCYWFRKLLGLNPPFLSLRFMFYYNSNPQSSSTTTFNNEYQPRYMSSMVTTVTKR